MPSPLTFGLSRAYVVNVQKPTPEAVGFLQIFNDVILRNPQPTDRFVGLTVPITAPHPETGDRQVVGFLSGLSSDLPEAVSAMESLDKLTEQRSGNIMLKNVSIPEPEQGFDLDARIKALKRGMAALGAWIAGKEVSMLDPEMAFEAMSEGGDPKKAH